MTSPDPQRIYTAALVVIGDEILSGRTHDRNIAQVASWLQVQGIRLAEVRVVPDVEARIRIGRGGGGVAGGAAHRLVRHADPASAARRSAVAGPRPRGRR